MPIETICQGCARKLRVPDKFAGKKARCPQCGMIYVVPGSPSAASPEPEDQPPTPEPTRRPDPEPAAERPSDFSRRPSTPDPGAKHTGERWQVRIGDGRVFGPAPKDEVDQWYREGRIPPEASLLREGDPQWRMATDIYPELRGKRAALDERQNPFAEARSAASFHPSVHAHRMAHRGGVILLLAILGWVICPILGPFAWAMGSGDLKLMQSGRMDSAGQGLTQVGMILGIIQTVLMIIGLFFMCLGGVVS